MNVSTATKAAASVAPAAHAARMPFLAQVAMLTRRSLVTEFRQPAGIVPGLFLGVFFLLVYQASLSGAAELFLRGQSYLGFILPLSVVSSGLSGAGAAGQALVRDINSGYFDKLLLTPVSRMALLLGPIIAAACIIVLQAGSVILVALLLGLQSATGVLGLLILLGYALLTGLALSGFIAGAALRTGSAGATTAASFLLFPLTFLTATFTPVDMLTGWIKTAARFNPITYTLEATRSALNTGWDGGALLRGLIVLVGVSAVTFAFAFYSLRTRTRRR
ncbi:MAG: ABC transporter permease [Chloroflexota bacterium]|nr:ABC transporter permease [Chloroflexota bacterium]